MMQHNLPLTLTKRSAMELLTLRYGMTKEALINRFGSVTDAIGLKAAKFVENDSIRILGQDGRYIHATCTRIIGYNKTDYSILHRLPHEGEKDVISCNCQYCVMTDRLCSHLLAYCLVRGVWEPQIDGGVRKKGREE